MPDSSDYFLGISETGIRLGFFLGALILFMAAEALFPRRDPKLSRRDRWTTNAIMVVLSNATVRLLAIAFPVLVATAAATYSEKVQFGVLHHIALPTWAELAVALLMLDFAIWYQHILSHQIPFLWRFHRVHHSDRELDASSALRFHPGEIAFSAIYKFVIILALGPSVLAVIAFEILLNSCAIFNHSNLALSKRYDGALRTLLVTPDMHRVHHSILRDEQSTNYGFCLSFWDRIFGKYLSQPKDGHEKMTLGLQQHQSEKPLKLFWSLKFPVSSGK